MSEKYEFIDVEKDVLIDTGEKKYTIVALCAWLEVSASGYYEWRGRPESATAQRRARLAVLVRHAFDDSDETYGHRRIHAQLLRWGQSCTPELVRGIMGELGLVACQPRPWRHSLTEADPAAGPVPDLVARDFTAEAPGEKMVGDITYVPTWEGWVFLATVIDCHTKAVIGWAMDDNYKTPPHRGGHPDGSTQLRPAIRCDIPLRPRQQLHVDTVQRDPGISRHPAFRRAHRGLLR